MLHVCIDDASRLAYTEILPDEKKQSAIAFLDRALAWFGRLGVAVERIMTDNGSAYRSHDFRQRIAAAGLKHIRTRPYTPRTNGKVERFIQTSLREWAYARPYHSSAERTHAMPPWITDYNLSRPHSALRHLTRRSNSTTCLASTALALGKYLDRDWRRNSSGRVDRWRIRESGSMAAAPL